MPRASRLAIALVLISVSACKCDDDPQPPQDAGSMDARARDASAPDASEQDASTADAAPDAGSVDADTLDTGPLDTGGLDAGAADASAEDAFVEDAAAEDAGPPDSGCSACPPDPATVAPPIDRTTATRAFDAYRFLFDGPAPVQTGTATTAIDPRRVVLVRGRVVERDGTPIPLVRVHFPGSPELGETLTRGDGAFDLVANGGGAVALRFEHPDRLTVDRSFEMAWLDTRVLPDVVMTARDANVTAVDLLAPATVQVVEGTTITDASGTRRASLLFRPGTTASFVLPDGSRVPATTASMRITEYTVGPSGEDAMPALLPPASGYTYAVEISSDEGDLLGADTLELSEPAPFYVDNFVGFPIGVTVPLGNYDRRRGMWVAADDGVVLEIVGVDGSSRAEIDLDGDSIAEDEATLEGAGISSEERVTLAGRHAIGASLWRVELPHFSVWDLNWSHGPPADAVPPDQDPPWSTPPSSGGDPPPDEGCECPPCDAGKPVASTIYLAGQVLQEELPLSGTPFELVYRSDRAPRPLIVPLTGAVVPASMLEVIMEAEIAGRKITASFLPSPGLRTELTWDGRDAYGRVLRGAHPLTVRVKHRYPSVYYAGTREFRASFARALGRGGFVVETVGRPKNDLVREWRGKIESYAADGAELGGFSLSEVHSLDRRSATLYQGDGRIRRFVPQIRSIGDGTDGSSGDGGPAALARLRTPAHVAVHSDGRVVISDVLDGRLRLVSADGIISSAHGDNLLANPSAELAPAPDVFPGWVETQGTLWRQRLTDPLPLTGAAYFFPGAVANAELTQDADVSAYSAAIDAGVQTFYFSGYVRTYAQSPSDLARIVLEYRDSSGLVLESFDSTEIVSASSWQLVSDARLAPIGTRTIRVRLIARRQAGSNNDGYFDALSLSTAPLAYDPAGVATTADGKTYVVNAAAGVVIEIDPTGTSTVFAGGGTPPDGVGDDLPATSAQLVGPTAIAVGLDGTVYVAETTRHRVRAIGTDGLITTVAGTGAAGSSGDGGAARRALLRTPRGLSVGADGALYIADTGNHRIRRVDSDGTIRRIAGTTAGYQGDGGPAMSARLSSPQGVFAARTGEVYIADTNNDALRVIRPDGAIETIAGGTDADQLVGLPGRTQLQRPTGLAAALDDQSTLYVADSGHHRVITIGIPDAATTIPAEDGRRAFVFDAEGRHLETRDTWTNTALLQLVRDAGGRLTSVVDAYGNTTTIQRDPQGRPTAIVGPYGHQTALTLDAEGRIETLVAPGSRTWTLGYQSDGLLASVLDPRGHLATFTYASGRLVRSEDPAGGSHDLTLQLVAGEYETTITTAEGRTSVVAAGARSAELRSPSGASRSHEDTGDRFRSTLVDGTAIDSSYGVDPIYGVPVQDAHSISLPSGLTASFAISGTQVGTPALLESASEAFAINGRTYTRTFDGATRTLRATSPMGREIVTTFDSLGRVAAEASPDALPVGLTYDTRGRLASATQGTRTYTFTYAPDGTLASLTDPAGRSTAYTHDAAGRLVRVVRPDGSAIDLEWDPRSNLSRVIPPSRPAHEYTYTPVNLESVYSPPSIGLPEHRTFTMYNLDRDPLATTLADGRSILRTYDVFGRLATETLAGTTYTFQYDAADRTNLISWTGGSVAYLYDGRRRASLTWTGAVAGTVQLAYDTDLRISGVTTGGSTAVRTYDADGALIGAGALAITYDPTTGQRTAESAGVVTDDYTHDAYGALATHTVSVSGAPVLSFTYTRDEMGRISEVLENLRGVVSHEVYSRDLADRISTVTAGAEARTYDYDANHNRTAFTGPGENVVATYDAQDRLLTYGDASFDHDAAGAWTRRVQAGATTLFSYDERGRSRRVDLPDGRVIEYELDGAGRRIGKRIDGTLVRGWLYEDDLRPAVELDGANQVISRFVYGASDVVPALIIRGGATYRVVTDHAGSVRMVVDVATGAVAQELDYDAFGRVLLDTSPGFQPFGFAGGLYDADTGLVRFGAREYDATTGRFTTRDPTGFAAKEREANLYTYAFNDPITYVDPEGTDGVDVDPSKRLDWLVEKLTGRKRNVHKNRPESNNPREALRDVHDTGYELGDKIVENIPVGPGLWGRGAGLCRQIIKLFD